MIEIINKIFNDIVEIGKMNVRSFRITSCRPENISTPTFLFYKTRFLGFLYAKYWDFCIFLLFINLIQIIIKKELTKTAAYTTDKKNSLIILSTIKRS